MCACTVVDQENGTIVFSTHGVKKDENVSAFDEKFDPDQFVESVWESKAVPVFDEKARDTLQVKAGVDADFDTAVQQYAVISNDKSGWVFVVKGSGTLREINRDSRNGIALVDLDSGNSRWTLQIQIGPVYKGMVLRDALPFISFSDYQNQIVFSGISSAFNRKIDRDVVAPSGIDNAVGKTLHFTGAFQLRDRENDWIVTPVKLSFDEE